MSGFNGINLFGSLTTQAGVKLNYEDFDKDKNGEITQEEYDAVMKDVKLDSVEFSSMDKDSDKVISEDEFAIYEQQILMQDAVNELKAQISKDFSGTASKFIADVTNALKTYLEEFSQSYSEDISGMAENFKNTLPKKYEEIKTDCLKNDPTTVKSEVLDELIEGLASRTYSDHSLIKSRRGKTIFNEETLQAIGKKLEAAADDFIKSYKGENLKDDLTAYLNEYLNTPDVDKMQDAAAAYRESFSSFGTYVDSNELTKLKDAAKEFLKTALEKGISVNLSGTEIKSETSITSALKKFDDAQALNDAIEEVISNLSELDLASATKAEVSEKAKNEAQEAFVSVSGSEYAIDPNTIDYTSIDGYFENKKVSFTSPGMTPPKLRENKFKILARDIIDDSLKSQMKSQIENMLKSKGIEASKVDVLFENVYNNSIDQAVEGVLNYDGSWPTEFYTKEFVDKFIEVFNTNIASAIDEMNASNTDLDLQDLDLTALNNNMPEDVDITKFTFVTGKAQNFLGVISDSLLGPALDGLKSQVMMKSRAMCEANGVEFDLSVFTTMFNNAKSTAVSGASVSNPLVTIFTTTFKTNYTAWVEGQKSAEE